MRHSRFCLQIAMLVMLALTMGACSQSSASAHPPTLTPPAATLLPTGVPVGGTVPPTPTGVPVSGTVLPTPTALPVTGALGAAPQNCPAGSALQNVAPSEFGMAAGTEPVWVSGFTGTQATLRLGASATHGQFGWVGHLQWNIHLPFPGPVTMQGYSQSGVAAALWFQSGTQAATTEPTLQSSQTGTGSDASWDKFPVTISIPQAGCYVISANWHDGSARIMFAAGQ